jgi:alpha-L-arabinofuranosidase
MKPVVATQKFGAARFLAACWILAHLWFSGQAFAEPAKLTVHVDRPGPRISPTLYGIFFEEINLAGDGGLYAELVRNRSFEDTDKPDNWSLVSGGSMKGQMAIDTQQPMSAKNRRSLRLTIAPGGEGRLGVANAGYYGIALQKDAEYELSFAARAGEGFAGPLTVTLEDPSGRQVYARTRIEGLTGRWKTFKAALTATAADPKARLVIAASQPGVLWLDMVSLFPKETWKGRANGLRPDLAQMLAGLRPSFMRFPGGCWVEGDFLRFAQRWKTTIGELSGRRTLWNLWQYNSTNGLGFHEYLQLCEDLGAEPLFVINCGMSHKEVVPMDRMAEWVQDALDAIEYANGPVASRFGAMRAKAGHPTPFKLKYMEIGNENGGPAYQERFPLFYDAIKARYPKMTLIADERTTRRRPDVVDEHYYSAPSFFIANAHKYDAYDRHGLRIYVGEYAVTAGCGQGNLQSAIGEAAFMTGIERNSDVVVMASYAPLFANVNYKKWNPDLINFDGSRVYGLPSYYVQKMFSENRGDVILPTTVKAAPLSSGGPAGGAIGLGTWSTQAEFKDVRVTAGDKTLFVADFTRGNEGWKPFRGQWSARQGALRQAAGETDCRIIAGNPRWNNYTLSLKARKLGGAEGFLIMCRVRDEKQWIWWNLGGWGNQQHGLEQCIDGSKSMLGMQVPGRIETGRWYDIRIELLGEKICCYLDGHLIHDVSWAEEPLYTVASRVDATGEIILKVVNVSRVAQDTELDLRGVQEVGPTARAIVLSSANPTDENSLTEPTKVAPVCRTIDGAAANSRHSFPDTSVTILRLTVR